MFEHRPGFLVRLRPRSDTIYASQSRTVLATELDGTIADGRERGLFVHQTRLLSRYRYLFDGAPPQPVALSNVEQHTWLGYYIVAAPGVEVEEDHGSGALGAASQETLELRVSRYVGEGLHEDLDITNFTQQPTSFEFTLDIDADFADQIETKSRRLQQGELKREWRPATGVCELVFDYTAEHHYHQQGNTGHAAIHRQLTVRLEHLSSPGDYREGRIVFPIDLPPGGRWHCCLNFIPMIDGQVLAPLYRCRSFAGTANPFDERRRMFLSGATGFESPTCPELLQVVVSALEQAKRDLASLRLYDLDRGERKWTMAAGLPIYVALFGRDTLTAAWQAALTGPEMMEGTLEELARRQGTETNPWRDEQPGRMLHEAHTGPLEALHYNPRGRYYGSITTSGFYPVVVAELWHWTGDRDLVRPLVEPALAALRWLDRYADLDGDGFYEYRTNSIQGVRHQAWKDSGDAIVDEAGAQVEPPIATCEEQGFVYLAKLHLAEVLWWLGERDEARRLRRQAAELKKRFNDVFWMEDLGFYAMGLDARNRPIRSIGSNAGHCLATGIVDRALAGATAGRLLRDDLFSGWGVRTLSSDNPAYNPYSYHRGSVWPVEQGTFAIGFMRYGLWSSVERIARAQFDTAALFEHYRLPEVFSGHARDAEHPFPAFYPQSNSPQAWSSSAIFSLLQAMLGLYPYAPFRTLFIDPHLPEWLPEIRLRNLRVGDAAVTILFQRRKDGATGFTVEDLRGRLHIVRQPSPWSITAGAAERLEGAAETMLPHTRAGRRAAGVAGAVLAGALGWWALRRASGG